MNQTKACEQFHTPRANLLLGRPGFARRGRLMCGLLDLPTDGSARAGGICCRPVIPPSSFDSLPISRNLIHPGRAKRTGQACKRGTQRRLRSRAQDATLVHICFACGSDVPSESTAASIIVGADAASKYWWLRSSSAALPVAPPCYPLQCWRHSVTISPVPEKQSCHPPGSSGCPVATRAARGSVTDLCAELAFCQRSASSSPTALDALLGDFGCLRFVESGARLRYGKWSGIRRIG